MAALQSKLDKLSKEYDEAAASKAEAEDIARRGTIKLALAKRLIDALGSESTRWKAAIEKLAEEQAGTVYGTDAIFSLLMASPRSEIGRAYV